MRLHGLLTAALADPALSRARELARVRTRSTPTRSTSPRRRRPAPVRRGGARRRPRAGWRRPAGAGGHRDHPGGGRAGRRAGRAACPADQVAVYPAWETLPHERLSPRSDTVGRRLAVLRRLAHPDADGAVGPLRVVVAPGTVGAAAAAAGPRRPGAGRAAPPAPPPTWTRWSGGWSDIAYARTDLVTKRGEFAVRGGILDVFPPTEEHPLRVEFWGDEIEEIRTLRRRRPAHARHGRPAVGAALPGAAAHRRRCAARARELAQRHPELAEMLDKLAEGIPVEGMESLAPALLDGAGLAGAAAATACRPAPMVLLCDPERIRTRAHDLVRTSEEFLQASWAAAAVGRQGAGRPRRGRVPDPGRGAARRPTGSASRGGR